VNTKREGIQCGMKYRSDNPDTRKPTGIYEHIIEVSEVEWGGV